MTLERQLVLPGARYKSHMERCAPARWRTVAGLEDGSGLLEGGGKALRSVRLNAPLDAARPGVKRIVQLASEDAVRAEAKCR